MGVLLETILQLIPTFDLKGSLQDKLRRFISDQDEEGETSVLNVSILFIPEFRIEIVM